MSDGLPTAISGLQVVRLLGRGGFASVFLARTADGELRAVKQLHPERRSFPPIVRAFEREAEMLLASTFPGVVRGLHFDREEWAIVMEYLEGPTLEWVIAEGLSRVPIHCRIFVGVELCAVLQSIHDRGWLHLDLKPNNVVLCRDGRIVLTDFGVAAAVGVREGERRPVLGTINYMSREQLAANVELDPRADIYSLGVMLYELFSGAKPYRISKATELRKALDRVKPLDTLGVSGLPVAVALAVQRALAYDRDARWRTMREFGELLSWELSGLSRADLANDLTTAVAELAMLLGTTSGRDSEPPLRTPVAMPPQTGRQPALGPPLPAPSHAPKERSRPAEVSQAPRKGRKPRGFLAAGGVMTAAIIGGGVLLGLVKQHKPLPPRPEPSPSPVVAIKYETTLPPATPTLQRAQPSPSPPPTRIALGELRVNCVPDGDVVSLRRERDGREMRSLVPDQMCPFPRLRLEEGRYTLVVDNSVDKKRLQRVIEVRGGQLVELKLDLRGQ